MQTAEAIAIGETITINIAVDAKQKLLVLFPTSMTKARWQNVKSILEDQVDLILEEGDANKEPPVSTK